MKLKDLTEKQVVQTTEKNHESFMKLLDKEGFKWCDGASYLIKKRLNDYCKQTFYVVKKGKFCDFRQIIHCNYEVIPASILLKPSKKEIIDKMDKVFTKAIETLEQTQVLIKQLEQKTLQGSKPKQPTSEQEQEFRDVFAKAIILKCAKERPDLFEGLKLPTIEEPKPTNPQVGDLCAFTDDENDFDSNDIVVRKLIRIDSNGWYVDKYDISWKYARKVEIKVL